MLMPYKPLSSAKVICGLVDIHILAVADVGEGLHSYGVFAALLHIDCSIIYAKVAFSGEIDKLGKVKCGGNG